MYNIKDSHLCGKLWLVESDPILRNLYSITWWQESIETQDQVRMTMEELWHTVYHPWRVNAVWENTLVSAVKWGLVCTHIVQKDSQNLPQ